jgi:quercetin dioxygenase-like cupin family protein
MARPSLRRTVSICPARQDELLTPYVEGVARQQHIEVEGRTSEIALLVVFFEAGSRNRPHTHEHDQTLLVLSGRTMVATDLFANWLSDS